MAGTVVATEETFGTVKKIALAWTSDAAGAADGVTLGAYSGEIRRLVTVPSGGGTAPTDLYDVTLNDEDGVDVLLGAGADRSSTVTQQVNAGSLGIVANDKLTLAVRNAGNAKQGTVYLYVR